MFSRHLIFSGQNNVFVVVHDFPWPLRPSQTTPTLHHVTPSDEEHANMKAHMESFRIRQPTTFESCKMAIICGRLDEMVEIDEQDWQELKEFIHNIPAPETLLIKTFGVYVSLVLSASYAVWVVLKTQLRRIRDYIRKTVQGIELSIANATLGALSYLLQFRVFRFLVKCFKVLVNLTMLIVRCLRMVVDLIVMLHSMLVDLIVFFLKLFVDLPVWFIAYVFGRKDASHLSEVSRRSQHMMQIGQQKRGKARYLLNLIATYFIFPWLWDGCKWLRNFLGYNTQPKNDKKNDGTRRHWIVSLLFTDPFKFWLSIVQYLLPSWAKFPSST